MSDQNLHFSSGSDDWETPQALFNKLNKEFNFNVDLCTNGMKNSKCDTAVMDIEAYIKSGLYNHFDINFMNPPYSRGLQAKCVRAAKFLSERTAVVVCLLPARTDTKMFHEYIWDEKTHKPKTGVEVRLLKGRIKFEKNGKPILDGKGRPQSAPFPSMIVIFKSRYNCGKLKGIDCEKLKGIERA